MMKRFTSFPKTSSVVLENSFRTSNVILVQCQSSVCLSTLWHSTSIFTVYSEVYFKTSALP